ncbi:phage portal protein [Micromonospora sp. WMMA1363]|uniref:phage portal protein n=1 Tax=Micromonospora sp. WMMA1363 TaxID=3053985 RepID=UPI00259CA1DE|nr:phage portal protein [Micromonospora sp. WMMA1363]MDM4718464.1 phage portal protein [Micromonospora sp. WMMA1363]
MSLFKRIERRAYAYGPKSVWDTDVETPPRATGAGVPVGPEQARTLAAVWACQSLIADGVASLPIDVFRRGQATGRRENIDGPGWLSRPNPVEQQPYTFWHKVMISLIGDDGNAFVRTVRDDSGKVISVYAVDPKLVHVDDRSPVPVYQVGGEEFTDREMLHIPAFVKPGKRRGLSVIDYAREAVGLGLAAEEFGARFFAQGTTMSGVVEHPGTPKPGEVAVLARMLRHSHAGVKKSHAVGILTGGASWKSISITPEQAQFLETRRFQKLEIASLYRVPPHMLDPTVQSSWGSGVEEQNKFFVDYTLVPWLVRLEQAFSGLLPVNQYLRFNVDARLRSTTTERFAAYAQAVNNGIMSLDEVRELEDMPPIPDGRGRAHVRPLNVAELGAGGDDGASDSAI